MKELKYKSEELLSICPACGFDQLTEPPYDSYGYPSYEICLCCGFEYGFTDSSEGLTFLEHRKKWISEGFVPFDKELHTKEWDKNRLCQQLENIAKVIHYDPIIIKRR